jgi:hypothetical protein
MNERGKQINMKIIAILFGSLIFLYYLYNIKMMGRIQQRNREVDSLVLFKIIIYL